MSQELPASIGRYQIVRELGRGMMGIVYEARDPDLGRTVAIKTIHLAFSITPAQQKEFEERFFTEARVAARLSHPGIVVCHDVGKDPATGTLFIVLEHLKGRPLSEVIRAGQATPWRDTLAICAKLARALDHAHQHGIVHRDMKPANVMLLDGGELDVKIMDFGIAKVETARIQLSVAGQSFGSPLYMSPEQALGEAVDARADIFALGTIACTLILGHPPFAAESIPAILSRVVSGERPRLAREVIGVPAVVDHVLGKAMARDAADRYATARMFAEDLDDVLAGRRPRHAGPVPDSDPTMLSLPSPFDPTFVPGRSEPASADGAELLQDLAEMVEEAVPPVPAVPVQRPRPPRGAPRTARLQPPPRSRGALWAWIGGAGVVAIVAVVAVLFYAMRLRMAAPDAEPPSGDRGATAAPAPVRPNEPRRARIEQPTLPPLDARGADTDERPTDGDARVDVVFEHGLKSGVLRLWVDEEKVIDEEVSARVAKKIVAVTVREGRLEKTLLVPPGDREFRVEVAWDDEAKVKTLSTSVEADTRRTLLVKIGRLRKNLSVEWQ